MTSPISVAALTLAFALGLVAAPASADPSSTGDLLIAAGASYRHVTDLDLAAIGGSEDFGADHDQSPGSLSFEVGAGMAFAAALELRASAWIGVGGLALAHVEERYFGGGPELVGSSLTVGTGGSLRYAPRLSSDLRLLIGPAGDWKRLTAASPLGSAHLELVGVGLDAGLRWRAGAVSRRIDGHLELVFSARRELPVGVWVGRSGDGVLFSGVQAGGDPIYSAGVGAAYVFSINDVL